MASLLFLSEIATTFRNPLNVFDVTEIGLLFSRIGKLIVGWQHLPSLTTQSYMHTYLYEILFLTTKTDPEKKIDVLFQKCLPLL